MKTTKPQEFERWGDLDQMAVWARKRNDNIPQTPYQVEICLSGMVGSFTLYLFGRESHRESNDLKVTNPTTVVTESPAESPPGCPETPDALQVSGAGSFEGMVCPIQDADVTTIFFGAGNPGRTKPSFATIASWVGGKGSKNIYRGSPKMGK